MIEQLEGVLRAKQPHRLVVGLGGVAVEVLIPFSSFTGLPDLGGPVSLLTHLHWREEGPQLFGFRTSEERELFRRMIRISKIGPKLAVGILSAAAPAKLVGMILAEDVKGLSALKGVGPKTAQRLVVELREGLGDLGLGEQVQLEQAAAARVVPHERDVREALANLGYSTREIDKAMDRAKNVVAPGADAETVLGAILRFIGNN